MGRGGEAHGRCACRRRHKLPHEVHLGVSSEVVADLEMAAAVGLHEFADLCDSAATPDRASASSVIWLAEEAQQPKHSFFCPEHHAVGRGLAVAPGASRFLIVLFNRFSAGTGESPPAHSPLVDPEAEGNRPPPGRRTSSRHPAFPWFFAGGRVCCPSLAVISEPRLCPCSFEVVDRLFNLGDRG